MSTLLAATGLALPGRLAATDFALGEELACLVGPNGSGKTSLLHAISGIGHPAGLVRIGGVNPRDLPPGQRLLAFVPASRDIAWPVAARDVIALGLPASADRGAIEAAVEALELSPFLDRRVDRLSTGERSRILIARALAARPKLLLLDEPVANLDPYWQLRLMEILGGLARSGGCGVLAALHDLDLAARFADRLVLMESGRIAADAAPGALLAGPLVRNVFGIERAPEGWRPVSPSAGPRSSR